MIDAAKLNAAAVKAAGHKVWQQTSGYPSTAQTANARMAVAAFFNSLPDEAWDRAAMHLWADYRPSRIAREDVRAAMAAAVTEPEQ